MVGIGSVEDKRGTGATTIKSGPKGFVIRGLYEGMKPSLKKSSSKLELWDGQTNLV